MLHRIYHVFTLWPLVYSHTPYTQLRTSLALVTAALDHCVWFLDTQHIQSIFIFGKLNFLNF